jgi:hypothetical protein
MIDIMKDTGKGEPYQGLFGIDAHPQRGRTRKFRQYPVIVILRRIERRSSW